MIVPSIMDLCSFFSALGIIQVWFENYISYFGPGIWTVLTLQVI